MWKGSVMRVLSRRMAPCFMRRWISFLEGMILLSRISWSRRRFWLGTFSSGMSSGFWPWEKTWLKLDLASWAFSGEWSLETRRWARSSLMSLGFLEPESSWVWILDISSRG